MPQQTLELVHLRASQINGCSFVNSKGANNMTKASVSRSRLPSPRGTDSELFDDARRAALALTEAATRLADRPGAVTVWDEAVKHYDEQQLSALVLMVGVSNFFNRVNTTLRVPPGTPYN